MFHIIGQMLFGLIAGVVARLLFPGHDPGGIVATMLLGIGGAWVGGFLGRALGWYNDASDGAGFLAAIVGAVLILFVYRLILKRR